MVLVILTFCVNNQPLSLFKMEAAAQIKPPEELGKLESVLYQFLLAADREGFAKTHHIFFRQGKVRVFIVTDPYISTTEKEGLIETYRIKVEKESENLLRATVPVEELTSLAKERHVWSIRLPDEPIVH